MSVIDEKPVRTTGDFHQRVYGLRGAVRIAIELLRRQEEPLSREEIASMLETALKFSRANDA